MLPKKSSYLVWMLARQMAAQDIKRKMIFKMGFLSLAKPSIEDGQVFYLGDS
jgi:hypothetical protein